MLRSASEHESCVKENNVEQCVKGFAMKKITRGENELHIWKRCGLEGGRRGGGRGGVFKSGQREGGVHIWMKVAW